MIMSMDSEFLYSYAEKIKDHFFPDNKKIKLSKKDIDVFRDTI